MNGIKNQEENLVLYILVRNDLPSLTVGKMGAQTAHAGNQFIHQYLDNSESKKIKTQIKDWQGCANGFGTTITLSVTEQDIKDIVDAGTKYYFACDKVVDPTYPFMIDKELMSTVDETKLTADPFYTRDGKVALCRSEVTCGFIFGDKNDPALSFLTSKYQLYK